MSYVMGPKGQIVVAKELRDQLGVGPGWLAIQQVKGDHLEAHFLPPSHRRSLKATLADRIDVTFEAHERGAAERSSERTQVESVQANERVDEVEAGEQLDAAGDVEHQEMAVDESQATMPGTQPMPGVPQAPAQHGESQTASTTTDSRVKRGRGRFGWRR